MIAHADDFVIVTPATVIAFATVAATVVFVCVATFGMAGVWFCLGFRVGLGLCRGLCHCGGGGVLHLWLCRLVAVAPTPTPAAGFARLTRCFLRFIHIWIA